MSAGAALRSIRVVRSWLQFAAVRVRYLRLLTPAPPTGERASALRHPGVKVSHWMRRSTASGGCEQCRNVATTKSVGFRRPFLRACSESDGAETRPGPHVLCAATHPVAAAIGLWPGTGLAAHRPPLSPQSRFPDRAGRLSELPRRRSWRPRDRRSLG